jgi:CheY-like chemotaxis protein
MSDKFRIMVIDDEEIVGKRLKPALEKRGDIIESFVNRWFRGIRLYQVTFEKYESNYDYRICNG